MIMRVVFLAALTTCLSVGDIHGDDASKIPSRKASIVIPLLNQILPTDSPQSVKDKVKSILGESDMAEAGGPSNKFWADEHYWLDDKTQILVGSINGKFDVIMICIPGQTWKQLYKAPKN